MLLSLDWDIKKKLLKVRCNFKKMEINYAIPYTKRQYFETKP